MTKCEIKGCRRESGLKWLGHPLCDDHFRMFSRKDLAEQLGEDLQGRSIAAEAGPVSGRGGEPLSPGQAEVEPSGLAPSLKARGTP